MLMIINTHILVENLLNPFITLFFQEQVNVSWDSDVLNIDPYFLKFSPDPYPKYMLLFLV